MKAALVTRTFTTTYATVLCLDTETAEPCNKDITLAGSFDDETKLLKACKKAVETDTLVVAKVVSVYEKNELRGMTVQQFIENSAVIIKPVNPESTN